MKAGQIVLDTPRQDAALATMQQLYQGDVRVDQTSVQDAATTAIPSTR